MDIRRTAAAALIATGLLASAAACTGSPANHLGGRASGTTTTTSVGQPERDAGSAGNQAGASRAGGGPFQTGQGGGGQVQTAGQRPAHAGLGTLSYLDMTHEKAPVLRWTAGRSRPVALTAALRNNFLNTNVSPNGHWGSYVDDTNTLRVVDLGTGTVRRSVPNIEGECHEPAWAPDSRHLLVGVMNGHPGQERISTLDVVTGSVTALRTQFEGCHPTWAADGTAIAYADGRGRIFVADADGSHQRAVPGLGAPGRPDGSFDLESVAAGGRRIALWYNDGSTPPGDVVRGLYSNVIVDTRTGAHVPVPVVGKVLQVLFRPDGSMVLRLQGARNNQVVLVSAAGTVLDRADEPVGLKDLTLLTA